MNIINKEYTYAIVGASNDPQKYGNIVMFDLLDAGYKVVPVNLKGGVIGGQESFTHLKDVPQNIDVVLFVVPPLVTEQVLEEVVELGITKVWMQPGASSEKAVQFCEAHSIECIHDMCIMISKNTA